MRGKDMEEKLGLLALSSGRRMDSSPSTPYESASCSPRSSTDRAASSYYSMSARTCPLTITCDIGSLPATGIGFAVSSSDACFHKEPSPEDFDFSARFSETDPPWSLTPMSSADELFYNGHIRPLWYKSEDLIHFSSDYGDKFNHDDEDNHFDFQSSADYKFSMFPASHSPAFAMNKVQRHVGYGYSRPFLDEYPMHTHGLVNKDGKEDVGELQKMKGFVQKWREPSTQWHDEMIAKQAMMLKVEGSRGRHAGGNKEGSIRRTRSLSPLRVFHMDDELPRQSLETSAVEQEEQQRIQRASGKGRRLTLKELLRSSSRTEHTCNQKHRETQQNKAYMEMDMEKNTKERGALCFKYLAKEASENKFKGSYQASQHLLGHHQVSMSPHGLHYASHTDQIRQQTFLPYRHGLLGCLGFTSKSYRSIAGIRAFHSKSQGTRRSTGYDSSIP